MTDNPRAEAIEWIARELWAAEHDGRWEDAPEGARPLFRDLAADIATALDGLLPRLVSSEAELDALPTNSIVRIGAYAYQALGNGWFNSPADPTYSEAMLDMAEGEPVWVLWTPPTEGVQA